MKNVKPFRSNAFNKTVRWDGVPSEETVAKVIAFGSWMPSSVACWNHDANCSIGSASRSSRWSPLAEYSFLKSDKSIILDLDNAVVVMMVA